VFHPDTIMIDTLMSAPVAFILSPMQTRYRYRRSGKVCMATVLGPAPCMNRGLRIALNKAAEEQPRVEPCSDLGSNTASLQQQQHLACALV